MAEVVRAHPNVPSEPHFGRVYAAYGGVFIVMSLVWATTVDRFDPDRWDLLGAALAFAGVLLITFGPRAR